LEAEHAAAVSNDLEEPKNEAHRAFTEADTELPKLQRRRQDLLDRTVALTREQSTAERTREEALRALEQLHKTGPDFHRCEVRLLLTGVRQARG
jgi:hypothetical protein